MQNGNGKYTLSEDAQLNLRLSGLKAETVEKMRVRNATPNDGINAGSSGYVIPYFLPVQNTNDYTLVIANGEPFKRIRIIGGDGPKYIQGRATGSHIYFPPIPDAKDWFDPSIPLVITEGEKKAAAACQHGILCCAVSGVDSWRSRTFVFQADRLAVVNNTKVSIRLEEKEATMIETQVAEELPTLPFEDRLVYLCYDNDTNPKTVEHVQRAAFDVAVWLNHHGASARQIQLPFKDAEQTKVALDDFLQDYGSKGFWKLTKRAQFPYRPKVKGWIQQQLASKYKNRDMYVKVAKAVLATLDRKGKRYRDKFGNYYYFDKTTDVLHPIPVGDPRSNDPFAIYLNNEFGISTADKEAMTRVMDDFRSVEPIVSIDRAYQGSVAFKDKYYFQLNDSRMVKITANDKVVMRNGDDGILFLSGSEPVELVEPPRDVNWLNILETTSLEPMDPLSIDETRVLVAGIFYLSPWLRRWSGMMLPVEIALGEAGSGKSTLFQLRKGIYTGSPRLNQPPDSIKDWYASVGNEHGIWVGDNMGHKLDDKFSNELARMVTDPEPTVEMRELYTTNDLSRTFVDCTFSFTAIYNPISKSDLLQRSFIYNFHNISGGNKDGHWLRRQLDGDGRAKWVAHHLDVIQKFLKLAPNVEWSAKSSHRLVYLEQALRVIGQIIGQPVVMNSALSQITQVTAERVAESDPVMEGLRAWGLYCAERGIRERMFTTADVVSWVKFEDMEERFTNIKMLSNARSLGKYITSHATEVAQTAGIYKTDRTRSGSSLYEFRT